MESQETWCNLAIYKQPARSSRWNGQSQQKIQSLLTELTWLILPQTFGEVFLTISCSELQVLQCPAMCLWCVFCRAKFDQSQNSFHNITGILNKHNTNFITKICFLNRWPKKPQTLQYCQSKMWSFFFFWFPTVVNSYSALASLYLFGCWAVK